MHGGRLAAAALTLTLVSSGCGGSSHLATAPTCRELTPLVQKLHTAITSYADHTATATDIAPTLRDDAKQLHALSKRTTNRQLGAGIDKLATMAAQLRVDLTTGQDTALERQELPQAQAGINPYCHP